MSNRNKVNILMVRGKVREGSRAEKAMSRMTDICKEKISKAKKKMLTLGNDLC